MPTWAPDGSRIAFVSFRSGRVGDIFTMRPDGKQQRRLTNTAAHEDMPRYSPDGTKIAFVRHTGDQAVNFHVFVMNADGTGARQITTTGAPNFAPTWSPDGTKLAFVTTRHGGGNPEIYAIDLETGVETRLTNHPSRDDSPHWSPDGSRIAFESNRTDIGTIRVFTMRPDGSDVRRLTEDTIPWNTELRPVWSPDGTQIAFVTERHTPLTNTEIYVIDADGTDLRRVTRNTVRDDTPAWSPDGRRIAISRGLALRPEIYSVAAEGGSARKLTGVNLRFVRLTRSTRQPVAGRYYSVELVVRPALDRFADVACYAVIGRDLLDVELGAVVRGRLRCAWFIPRSAKGKKVHIFAGARAGGTQASREIAVRIK